MTQQIDRRAALAGLGTVGLGALLTACTGSQPGPTSSAQVPTSGGGSATVAPQTSTSASLAELFDKANTCVRTPEQTEGPYYFDVDSIRSDIREDRQGVGLHLGIRVQDAVTCAPLSNVVVDIWHCDAGGLYSGFETASLGGAGGRRSDQKTYLRGAQVTNAAGIVEFRTVYPGWYRGRTVHIHTKVHLNATRALTTQLYFDEAVTTKVYATAPYRTHTGRDTLNSADGILRSGGGTPPMLTPSGEGSGYLGIITIAAR